MSLYLFLFKFRGSFDIDVDCSGTLRSNVSYCFKAAPLAKLSPSRSMDCSSASPSNVSETNGTKHASGSSGARSSGSYIAEKKIEDINMYLELV